MARCPSCGFDDRSRVAPRTARSCPRCGRGDAADPSPAALVRSVLATIGLLAFTVAAVAANASPRLVLVAIAAVVLLAMVAVVVGRTARPGVDGRQAGEGP